MYSIKYLVLQQPIMLPFLSSSIQSKRSDHDMRQCKYPWPLAIFLDSVRESGTLHACITGRAYTRVEGFVLSGSLEESRHLVCYMYTCVHPPLYMYAYTLRENGSQRAFGRDSVALRIGWFTHNGAAIKATEDLIHPPSQGFPVAPISNWYTCFIIGMANSAAVLKRCVWIPGWFSSNQRAGVSYNKCFIHNSW